MRIEYELVPEDWAAFAEYCAGHEPSYRNVARTGRALGAFLLAGLCVIPASAHHDTLWLGIGVVAAAAWIWLWPRFLVKSARENAVSKERPCLRGRHTMESSAEGLSARCEVTDSVTRWPGITAVHTAGDYVFVMLGECKGYTINRRRLVAGNIDGFLEDVARHRS
jgi:hypothetical protein